MENTEEYKKVKEYLDSIPYKRRVNSFMAKYNMTDKYPVKDLLRWHMIVTKSCPEGIKTFAENHGMDIENGMMTVPECIELAKDAFGGDILKDVEIYMKSKAADETNVVENI